MVSLSKIKHYGWYIFGILGVAIFWGGLWGSADKLVNNFYITFIIGLVCLVLANMVREKMDPSAGAERDIYGALDKVKNHPKKHQFNIKYHDKIKKKHISIKADKLYRIEEEHLVFIGKGKKEEFIPIHRIKEILHLGKNHWKPKKN